MLAAHPDHAPAHFGLGNALAATRQLPAALASYEAALRIRPDYADAQRHLAQVRAVLGR